MFVQAGHPPREFSKSPSQGDGATSQIRTSWAPAIRYTSRANAASERRPSVKYSNSGLRLNEMSRRGNNVRSARVDDARAIADVHVASWRTTYKGIFPDTLLDGLSVDKREQSWRETLAASEPSSVTLVACDVDGSIVGFISGGVERTGRLGYEGEVYAIYLLQSAQRQGLGTLLVRHFVGELRARGVGSMAVWVLAANPFRQFYAALGEQLVAEQQIERGGQSFTESAYGWQDLDAFRDTGKTSRSTSLRS
jgi:GNAT superfamily N-acetyltransferase